MSSIIEALQRRRQAAGAATEARRVEQEAVAAAEAARRVRVQAEKALPAANREAEQAEAQLARDAENQLQRLRDQLAAAKALEGSPAKVMHVSVRGVARAFLYGGGDEGGVAQLGRLASEDASLGAYLEASRVGGRLELWLSEQGEGLGEQFTEADRLECAAWAACVRRVHVLAGELS